MPIWCPKCNAMLPAGLETCPACGARLPPENPRPRQAGPDGEAEDAPPLARTETAWITGYLLAFLLIPLVIMLVLGLLCVLVFNLGR
jgi:hypothetical protein